MTIQTKTHSKPEKRERFKVLQKEGARHSEGSIGASARSGQTAGDQHHPIGARAYAAQNPTAPLGPLTIPRREVGARDVRIDILFCGVCHSDLHQVRNEWHNTVYPCVPGHEIVGRVVKVGREVKKFGSSRSRVGEFGERRAVSGPI